QHGVNGLDDELIERRCVEAIRLLTLLWIVHCFERTEAAGEWRQWQQHSSVFYAELFGNSNPRQLIQCLYNSQLSNIEMMLVADTLRIRLELLDCSCDDSDDEWKLARSFIPHDTTGEIIARPTLTFLKFNHYNLIYPLYHGI
ncbi:unnamed protein product, partial [Litomosoides sigmodontis]